MNQIFISLFYSVLFVVITCNTNGNITGQYNKIIQYNGPELFEALEDNNHRIDYSMGLPFNGFPNYIFIKGWIWNLKLTVNTLDGYEVEVVGSYPNSDDRHGYRINLDRTEAISFHHKSYICGYSFKQMSVQTNNTVVIAGLNSESEIEMIFFHYNSKTNKSGTTANLSVPMNESVDTIRTIIQVSTLIKNGHKNLKSSGFRPQVAFIATSEESNGNKIDLIVFIHTTVVSGKYQSICQTYRAMNLTYESNTDPRIPQSVLLAANDYYIKGVFPVDLLDTNQSHKKGFILLIELCTTQDLPCTGHISYHYCFVEKTEMKPTAEGKPCHQNNIKFLFESAVPSSPTSPLDITTEPPKQTTAGNLWWILIIIILIIAVIIGLILIFIYMKYMGSKSQPISSKSEIGGPSAAPSVATELVRSKIKI